MAELPRSLEVELSRSLENTKHIIAEQVVDRLLNMQLVFYNLPDGIKDRVLLFRETSEIERLTFGPKQGDRVHLSNCPVYVVLKSDIFDILKTVQSKDKKALLKLIKRRIGWELYTLDVDRILYNLFTSIQIYLTYSPFGNCQTLSIANFNKFFECCNNTKLNPLKTLSEITECKAQVVVDIRDEDLINPSKEELDLMLKSPENTYFDVITKTSYKNSTTHNMCTYLLRHKKRENAFNLIYGLHLY